MLCIKNIERIGDCYIKHFVLIMKSLNIKHFLCSLYCVAVTDFAGYTTDFYILCGFN